MIMFVLHAWLHADTTRVPLYALSSLIALFSLEAAFFIDTVRDLYEVRYEVKHTRLTSGLCDLHFPITSHHLPWR